MKKQKNQQPILDRCPYCGNNTESMVERDGKVLVVCGECGKPNPLMEGKKVDFPINREGMGKKCPSCGWRAEIISTHKDGTITVACANCFLDKTQQRRKQV